ncbi:MAG TPA: 50S ribosomal protein L30 [Bacillota bacterium]|nr:50S ribosomal protein L30 [Bacillota bacterium]HPF42009.1 50S ribosomal protein L30 [Bacillota bacterium]HPJ85917.1 50S ribosomal protein L30 [Bacillota bacterium]HPQ61811.1 50S ribosomal protein L30 [Bacillota bacterium]HRX91212.1 50S ribosomal protein L30 [Candidatus Izemoplasmatales bacterium]
MAKIKITLVKGLVGRKPNQVKTVKALGLKKRNSSVVKEDNDAIRGMINTVAHLVKTEEAK